MEAPKTVVFDAPAAPVVEPVAKSRNVSKKRRRKKVESKTGKENKFKVAFTNRRVTRLMSKSANNELSKGELSCLTEDEKLQLTSWGLPVSVIAKYKSKGITSLFPWQLECLGNEKVLEGRNLLYSAPTSAGKTLVAEILMVKRVLELGKKAIMILPFVSVCREKMFSLQEIFGDAGVRVEGFMGSYNPPGGFKAVDIAICTIEKANSLINRLLEEKCLSQLGTIVVDELHLIGDPHRGYLLELLLTKIKFMMSTQRLEDMTMSEDDTKESKRLNLQIIGMSATLPNLELLSTWIDGELVVTDYRPVPLVERVLLGDKIYDPSLLPIRDVKTELLPLCLKEDDNHIIYLSLETVLAGHSVLIFCPTKANCENLAQKIAQEIWNIGNPMNPDNPEVGESLRKQLSAEGIKDMLVQLEQCPGGMDDVLKKTVSYAVAFHHAGLTYDERDIIESSFKRGVLRVIVATSTLSAGVNLPARRVIVSTPMFNGGILDVLTYRQMCGRAGRKGVDTEGESILICSNDTKAKGVTLVQSSLPCVRSALLGDQGALTSSMKRALLEVVASGIATHPAEVERYSKCTLLSRSIELGLYENEELLTSQQNQTDTIDECLKFLVDNDFIRLQQYENEDKSDGYMATQLGSACLASSLAPDEGITVYKELLKARKSFVLESELHVVYQVTPIYLSDQLRSIPWTDYLNIWNDLSTEDKLVATLVGVDEAFIMRVMIGTISKSTPKNKEKFMVHHRFFAALALNDLVNETSISDVGQKYGLNKGVIQNLQQSAATFAGMVTAFCGRLGWSNLELLLSQFQDRLQFGVQRELCDMVRLSTMNAQRARILYDNGIKTVAELAAADPAEVESILHQAIPFLSSVHGEGKTSQIQRNVWMLGKTGLSESEAAQNIVEEARQCIQVRPTTSAYTTKKKLKVNQVRDMRISISKTNQFSILP